MFLTRFGNLVYEPLPPGASSRTINKTSGNLFFFHRLGLLWRERERGTRTDRRSLKCNLHEFYTNEPGISAFPTNLGCLGKILSKGSVTFDSVLFQEEKLSDKKVLFYAVRAFAYREKESAGSR